MTQSGRRSGSSLNLVHTRREQPPEPPRTSAKEVWVEITTASRPSYVRGAEPLLGSYRQLILDQRKLAAQLNACDDKQDERYADLLRLHIATVNCLLSTATKLRLTVQASRDSRHTKLSPI